MKEQDIKAFGQDLLDWYQANHRDLPWRRTSNPYYIWLSEVMLQQTQVETVKAYYQRFIEKYPKIEDLAEADEHEVLKMWEGLGYYSRARNLHIAIKEVASNYDGQVPRDPEVFGRLKGVGPYTKGSVTSIAYGAHVPAVDGNVFRVWSRLNLLADDITKPQTRKLFEAQVLDAMPEGQASHYNQALMELGALICRPKQALCEACPVRAYCEAYQADAVYDFPVKSKKVKNKPLYYDVYLLRDSEGYFLMQQRPSQGLLANMWEFPMYEDEISLQKLEEDYDIDTVGDVVELMQLKHVFTHLTWHLKVYVVHVSRLGDNSPLKAIAPTDFSNYTLAVPVQKMVKAFLEADEAGY